MNLQLSSSPLVSVVIPVYNGEMHISVCMDSILCQSFSSFEAIFVDDGSVDNSFRILSERASFDRRMKVIRQENMGVTCARRNGVKHAGGKYICFVAPAAMMGTAHSSARGEPSQGSNAFSGLPSLW